MNIPWGNKPELEKLGEEIVEVIRERRDLLQQKIRQLRQNGDKVIKALH